MKLHTNCLRLIILLSSLFALSGCTTPGKHMIPVGGSLTMAQIYKQEMGMSHGFSSDSSPSFRGGLRKRLPRPDYVAYTASSENEVNSLFKPAPNPEIPLYIYPHLVRINGEAYPKPGITTDFFLYKKNHFAMPNDVY